MRFKPDFLIVPYKLIEDKNLSSLDCRLYSVIYYFEHLKNGRCTASNKLLAELCQTENLISISNSLLILEKFGYIKRYFKDEKLRHRIEIKSLVTFSKKGKIDEKLDSSTDESDSSTDESRFTHRCITDSSTDEHINNSTNKKEIDIVDFSPKGPKSTPSPGDLNGHLSCPKGAALENAGGSEGTSLDSLHGNMLLSKKLSSNVTGSQKKEKKQTDSEYVKKMAEKYFIPQEERTDPECKFDNEKYFDDLTNQKWNGRYRSSIIIGNYFNLRGMKFMTAKAAYSEFKRNIKPAMVLVEYKADDIEAAFDYLMESKFGRSFSWTLETVAKYVIMPEIVDGGWRRNEKG